jgi:hypothetical protein
MFLIDTIRGGLARLRDVFVRVLRAIGFTIELPSNLPTDCDDAGQQGGCGPNPRTCGSSQGLAFSPQGPLAEYATCGTGPHTLVRATAGHIGLDAAARAELRFAPTSVVTVRVVRFAGPARIEAFNGAGLAGMQMMTASAGVEQQFTFRSSGIDRIVVTPAAPNDGTLVIGWCH